MGGCSGTHGIRGIGTIRVLNTWAVAVATCGTAAAVGGLKAGRGRGCAHMGRWQWAVGGMLLRQ
jgi:hypothetical protein